jgi:hypothetical protein
VSTYEERAEALYFEADKLGRMLAIQVPGSPLHTKYQLQIEELSHLREAWLDAAPELRKLDAEISAASREVQAIQVSIDDEPWSRVALASGVLGGGLVLLSLVLDFGLTAWGVAVALILIAVGAARLSARSRELAREELDEHQQVLNELVERRKQRMPQT